jgi:hypothetical protein
MVAPWEGFLATELAVLTERSSFQALVPHVWSWQRGSGDRQ